MRGQGLRLNDGLLGALGLAPGYSWDENAVGRQDGEQENGTIVVDVGDKPFSKTCGSFLRGHPARWTQHRQHCMLSFGAELSGPSGVAV